MTNTPSNDALIRNFLCAWNARQVDDIMAFFHDDAHYCNVPMGPAHIGKRAIREFIEGFISGAENIDFQLRKQVCAGDVVMNERLDILEFSGKRIELPVMGVFEMRDGLISHWRDYFDMAAFAPLMA
ncbi:nuclear transport factor 2 family protein [Spongiibacter sp.]|uniref:nuclear transport factor 2 family protein n=1 Tax=Spongiibacter sp. TaxID=2024860 RepID=UPI0035696AD6